MNAVNSNQYDEISPSIDTSRRNNCYFQCQFMNGKKTIHGRFLLGPAIGTLRLEFEFESRQRQTFFVGEG